MATQLVTRTYFPVVCKCLCSSLSSLPTRVRCSVVVLTFPMRQPKLGDLQEIPKGCVAN